MKPTINSVKHYFHTPATGVASGVAINIDIVKAIAKGATRANPFDVEEGAIVKALFVEYWVKADNPNFTVSGCIVKRPANAASPTFTEMGNMGSYPNKKNVFEFHQGLAPSGGNVVALFRHWVAIPKGKQRMGLDDRISMKFAFTGSAGDVCGFTTYKEYE